MRGIWGGWVSIFFVGAGIPTKLCFTSVSPLFYLINPCSAGNLEPWFGNHDLQALRERSRWRSAISGHTLCKNRYKRHGPTPSSQDMGRIRMCPRQFYNLSVLKRDVPKTLAFAFGLRLRSKTRCFKTRFLGRRLPNGKPQERLRFRALRSKTLAFKKSIAIISFAI